MRYDRAKSKKVGSSQQDYAKDDAECVDTKGTDSSACLREKNGTEGPQYGGAYASGFSDEV